MFRPEGGADGGVYDEVGGGADTEQEVAQEPGDKGPHRDTHQRGCPKKIVTLKR